jgi:hypothetical protein
MHRSVYSDVIFLWARIGLLSARIELHGRVGLILRLDVRLRLWLWLWLDARLLVVCFVLVPWLLLFYFHIRIFSDDVLFL